MSKSNGYSLADFIVSQMANEGFTVSEIKGMPGQEIVTYKNAKGETRIVECGFSSAERPRKNYRVYLNPNGMKEIEKVSYKKQLRIKVDFTK